MALDSLKKKLGLRWWRFLFWGSVAIIAYTVFGFLIAPLIARSVAAKQLGKLLDREVVIEKVLLNPYVLSGTIRGLLVKDKDGETFISWQEVHANFQLSSFFGLPWVFKEVRVVQPFVRVQVNKDDTLNFSDLLKKFAEMAAESGRSARPRSEPLHLRVDSLSLSGAEASYADLTTSTPFQRRIGPVELTMTGLRTDPSNRNPYSFSGSTDSGEKFSWSGHFFLDPIRSSGEFAIENVALVQHTPIFQDFVKFEVRDGIADVRAAYDIGWSASDQAVSASNVTVRLRSLKVAEKGATENFVELADLKVGGASVDALGRRAEIDSVQMSGGRLLVRRDTNAIVNLVDLAQPANTNVSGSVLLMLRSVTNLFGQLLNSTNAGMAIVRQVNIEKSDLTFEDLVNPRPVRLSLTDLTFAATNLSNLPGTNLAASASMRWNTNGVIRANVEAAFRPPSADVELALEQLELAPLGPYIDPFISVFIVGSRLKMDGVIRLRTTNEIGPTAGFEGHMSLQDFASVDGDTGEDLLKFREAKLTGMNAHLNPPQFSLTELALNDLSALVELETNGTLNLMRVARLSGTNLSETAGVQTETAGGAKKTFADLRRQFGSMVRLFSATNLAAVPVPVKASVATVVISNAQVNIADLTITPAVRTSLRDVNGQVTGLSSDFDTEISANLQAKVDAGPIEITASIPPPGPSVTNRLKVAIKEVDLQPAGPYSGKFLGYNLRKGKFNLEAEYQMTDRRIKARNVLVLDQFSFGEKVESTNATQLPVKLAVAILKDRSGKIELDLPIEGDLNDPQIRFGKIITQAIVNVITKIATSPFAALGAIFGGEEEDMSFQEFAAGKSELTAANTQKLDKLINGLYERPGLELEIEGSVDPAADLDALRRLKLENEFKTQKWATLRTNEQDRASLNQIILAPEDYATFVQHAYATKFLSEGAPAVTEMTNVVEQVRPPSSGLRSKWKALFGKKTPKAVEAPAKQPEQPNVPQAEMERALLESMEIADSDYGALAAQRANAVKDYILKGGKVEAERLFLTDSSNGVSTNGSRVNLQLR